MLTTVAVLSVCESVGMSITIIVLRYKKTLRSKTVDELQGKKEKKKEEWRFLLYHRKHELRFLKVKLIT